MIQQIKESKKPRVGVGVLFFNDKGQVLLGKRKNSHGDSSWAPPGEHLEFGESLENFAIREVLEETGLKISSPTFVAISNDVFQVEEKHYLTICMRTNLLKNQKVQNMEPHKNEGWHWFDLNNLPEYLFLPYKQLLLISF